MRNLIRHLLTSPQTAPLPGEPQVQNHAGGFVFEVDAWKRLERFLVLGSDGGTYYVSERTLTLESAQVVLDCLAVDPERAVALIASVSTGGRAPSNRAALFALALAFCEPKAVPAARAAFTDVVRTGTHLFEFLTAVKGLRGFGRALRGAVADWYVTKPIDKLAYQLVKYRQRSGWTHRDVLRLAHPKDGERNALFAWAAGRSASEGTVLPPIVGAFAAAQVAPLTELPALIHEHGLTHEMLPSEALTCRSVLKALAENMPLGALVRFLGRLSAAGVLTEGSRVEHGIVARLKDTRAIRRARLHPMALLTAQRTYAAGHGDRGALTWQVSKSVVRALDNAFHKAFTNVTPSGKRVLLGVDVSGSMMGARCAGARSINCAEGAIAMAMVTAGTEKGALIRGFSYDFVDLHIDPEGTVEDALHGIHGMRFGATDCALPMLWALEERVAVDAFVILTDNETWYGKVHPKEALARYRKATGINARLVVVSLAGTEFSIADPNDPLSMDVVGFDTTTPALISDFIAGRL